MSKTIIYLANVSPLNNKELFDNYYLEMPKYRQQKIDRYVFNEDKMLSLGVGILLKKACNDFNIQDSDNNICFNEYNKPYFNNLDIYFSLSHSKKMAMCAMSTSEVGCDIEHIETVKESVCKKVFTNKEIKDFDANNTDGFYSLWVLKESYLKRLGVGLNFDPRDVEFDKNLTISLDKNTLFYLSEIDGYKFACAYQTKDIKIKSINL